MESFSFSFYIVSLRIMKMKLKYIFILIGVLCFLVPVSAQNTISSSPGSSASGRSLGTHDRNGNPIDTTAVTDASTIPIGDRKSTRLNSSHA